MTGQELPVVLTDASFSDLVRTLVAGVDLGDDLGQPLFCDLEHRFQASPREPSEIAPLQRAAAPAPHNAPT